MPFNRQLMQTVGGIGARRETVATEMRRGVDLAVIPGGIDEVVLADPVHERVFLKRRFGFVKLALEHGYDLVPVYHLGESQMYGMLPLQRWGPILRCRLWMTKRFSLPFGFGVGCWYCPVLPRRVPCVSAVGDPVVLPKIDSPTMADVAKYHARYRPEPYASAHAAAAQQQAQQQYAQQQQYAPPAAGQHPQFTQHRGGGAAAANLQSGYTAHAAAHYAAYYAGAAAARAGLWATRRLARRPGLRPRADAGLRGAAARRDARVARALRAGPGGQPRLRLRGAAEARGASAPRREYKTKMCLQIVNGRPCAYGDKCKFAHSEGELRRSAPDYASAAEPLGASPVVVAGAAGAASRGDGESGEPDDGLGEPSESEDEGLGDRGLVAEPEACVFDGRFGGRFACGRRRLDRAAAYAREDLVVFYFRFSRAARGWWVGATFGRPEGLVAHCASDALAAAGGLARRRAPGGRGAPSPAASATPTRPRRRRPRRTSRGGCPSTRDGSRAASSARTAFFGRRRGARRGPPRRRGRAEAAAGPPAAAGVAAPAAAPGRPGRSRFRRPSAAAFRALAMGCGDAVVVSRGDPLRDAVAEGTCVEVHAKRRSVTLAFGSEAAAEDCRRGRRRSPGDRVRGDRVPGAGAGRGAVRAPGVAVRPDASRAGATAGRRLLVLADMNGTLLVRTTARIPGARPPDLVHTNRLYYYLREGAAELVAALAGRADVVFAFYTSMQRRASPRSARCGSGGAPELYAAEFNAPDDDEAGRRHAWDTARDDARDAWRRSRRGGGAVRPAATVAACVGVSNDAELNGDWVEVAGPARPGAEGRPAYAKGDLVCFFSDGVRPAGSRQGRRGWRVSRGDGEVAFAPARRRAAAARGWAVDVAGEPWRAADAGGFEAPALVPLLRCGCERLALCGEAVDAPRSLLHRFRSAAVEATELTRNYRQHPRLADFASRHFYGGAGGSGASAADFAPVAGLPWPRAAAPACFVETGASAAASAAAPFERRRGGSFVNGREAARVALLVERALEAGLGAETSPSSRDAAAGRRPRGAAPGRGVRRARRLRGRAFDLVVVSCVRSNEAGDVGPT
ncbi:hypothetical protein JL722_2633 [Aureococcus anophagefferens]|nr:hypothetical protein JL722_2633 [Aureococcus anophagefferens]